MRASRIAAAGLMRRDQHIGPHECRRPDVLHEVVVVTDQNADADTPGCVENRVSVAAANLFMFEGMELAMHMNIAVRQRHEITVEQFTIRSPAPIPMPRSMARLRTWTAEGPSGSRSLNRSSSVRSSPVTCQ